MAASWDVAALHGAARVMSDEQRAKHNIKTAETGGDSIMDYGLDLWGPNINMFRRACPPCPSLLPFLLLPPTPRLRAGCWRLAKTLTDCAAGAVPDLAGVCVWRCRDPRWGRGQETYGEARIPA